TKRVTSLADAMKLSFGIVTTDRRRAGGSRPWNESAMFEQLRLDGPADSRDVVEAALDADAELTPISKISFDPKSEAAKPKARAQRTPSNPLSRRANGVAGQSLSQKYLWSQYELKRRTSLKRQMAIIVSMKTMRMLRRRSTPT
nr:hypothetical protein [Tanacetum cinerariifolium]